MSTNVEVGLSDLLKIQDALSEALAFCEYRDQMNARTHLAREVRYSPMTIVLQAANERPASIIIAGGRTNGGEHHDG